MPELAEILESDVEGERQPELSDLLDIHEYMSDHGSTDIKGTIQVAQVDEHSQEVSLHLEFDNSNNWGTDPDDAVLNLGQLKDLHQNIGWLIEHIEELA